MSANDWPGRLLAGIGAPVTRGNMVFIRLWEQAEGSKARWNPLATSLPAPGATDFNSHGVKHYPSEQVGLDATITTLRHPRYTAVVEALKSGDANAAARAVVESKWGTGPVLLDLVADAGGNAVGDAIRPGDVAGGIGNVVGGAVEGVKSVGDLVNALQDGKTWLRVLQVVGGLAAVAGGLVLLQSSTVKKAASAVGGAVPGVVAGKAVTAGAGAARAAAAAAV